MDIGDGHEEKLAAMQAHNEFEDFAQPAHAAFDAGWDAAKKKAAAEIERLRAELAGRDAEIARYRVAICAIYEAREAEDFDGLMDAIDEAFAEVVVSSQPPMGGE